MTMATIATKNNLKGLHALKADLMYHTMVRHRKLYRISSDDASWVEQQWTQELWTLCPHYSDMGLPDKIIKWACHAVTGYYPW